MEGISILMDRLFRDHLLSNMGDQGLIESSEAVQVLEDPWRGVTGTTVHLHRSRILTLHLHPSRILTFHLHPSGTLVLLQLHRRILVHHLHPSRTWRERTGTTVLHHLGHSRVSAHYHHHRIIMGHHLLISSMALLRTFRRTRIMANVLHKTLAHHHSRITVNQDQQSSEAPCHPLMLLGDSIILRVPEEIKCLIVKVNVGTSTLKDKAILGKETREALELRMGAFQVHLHKVDMMDKPLKRFKDKKTDLHIASIIKGVDLGD